jgi:hypothetical protein
MPGSPLTTTARAADAGPGDRRARGGRGTCGAAGGLQVGSVSEDVALESTQLRPGLNADLLGQDAAGVGQRAQRVGLAAGPVEGERKVAPEPFVERVVGDR